jgi:glycosyltransferase involved in cell wall biosynthesis
MTKKIVIIDELHDIKRSGVFYSTEALKDMFRDNDIECSIIGIKKRGRIFNTIICIPFFRECVLFPLWNLFTVKKIEKLGYDVAFYQCSTALLLVRKSQFKRVLYTRALLARRLSIYAKIKLPARQKIIIQLLRPLVYFTEKWSFRHADRIVASKAHFSQYLQDAFSIDKDRFAVVPQMIDIAAPKSQNQPSKRYDLLFIGRLTPPKNWQQVLNIAEKSSYKIAAATPEISNHEDIPKNIDVYTRVPYHELGKLIESSRIFIMPSYNEEGPRVTLEAMAFGLPIVASIEGSGGFVEEKINGLVVGSDDVSDYMRAIDKLIHLEPEQREAMRKKNMKKALQYTPDHLGPKYIQALTF